MAINYGDAALMMKATGRPPYDWDSFDGPAGPVAGRLSGRGRVWSGSALVDGSGNLVGTPGSTAGAYLQFEEHISRLDMIIQGPPGGAGTALNFYVALRRDASNNGGLLINFEDSAVGYGVQITQYDGSSGYTTLATTTLMTPERSRYSTVRIEDTGPGTNNIRAWVDVGLAVKASATRDDGPGVGIVFWPGDTGMKVGAVTAWTDHVPYPVP